MKNVGKKLCVFLLVAVMVVGLLPAAAFAESEAKVTYKLVFNGVQGKTGALKCTRPAGHELIPGDLFVTGLNIKEGTWKEFEAFFGGTEEGVESATLEKMHQYWEANPVNGYIFKGWFDAAEGGNEIGPGYAVQEGERLYAHAEKEGHAVEAEQVETEELLEATGSVQTFAMAMAVANKPDLPEDGGTGTTGAKPLTPEKVDPKVIEGINAANAAIKAHGDYAEISTTLDHAADQIDEKHNADLSIVKITITNKNAYTYEKNGTEEAKTFGVGALYDIFGQIIEALHTGTSATYVIPVKGEIPEGNCVSGEPLGNCGDPYGNCGDPYGNCTSADLNNGAIKLSTLTGDISNEEDAKTLNNFFSLGWQFKDRTIAGLVDHYLVFRVYTPDEDRVTSTNEAIGDSIHYLYYVFSFVYEPKLVLTQDADNEGEAKIEVTEDENGKTLTGTDLVDTGKATGAAVEDVIKKFEDVAGTEYKVQVVDKDGAKIEEGNPVGTGSVVQLLNQKGEAVDEITIVVKGDVDGNAEIDVGDATTILNSIVGASVLDGPFEQAAQLAGDGITVADATTVLNIIANQKP